MDVTQEQRDNNVKGDTTMLEPDDRQEDDFDDCLDEDDEEDEDEDEEEVNSNDVEFVSVYTGKRVLKPMPIPPSSSPSPSTLHSSGEQYFALRRGKSTSNCIYVRREDLQQQIENYSLAEYQIFDSVKDALTYIQLTTNSHKSPTNSTSIKTGNAVIDMTTDTENIISSSQSQYVSIYSSPTSVDKGKHVVEKGRSQNALEIRWNKHFTQLRKFKETNGHLDFDDEDKTVLGKWCGIQRYNYIKFKKGSECGFISQEKIQKLLDIGFDIDPPFDMTKSKRKNAQKFLSRLEELEKYRDEQGSIVLPKEERTAELCRWLKDQNTRCLEYIEDKNKDDQFHANPFFEDKIKRLKKIGLFGIENDKLKGKTYIRTVLKEEDRIKAQKVWDDMYNQLIEYKRKHGNSHIPPRPLTPIRRWFNKQRRQFKLFISGQQSEMTAIRLHALNQVQFPFGQIRVRVPWEKRYEELQQYKAKHGNVLVPRDLPGGLGTWLKHQRSNYRNTKAGRPNLKCGYLKEEHMKRLDDIGMVWQLLPTPAVPLQRKTWDERVEELLEFNAQYGHMRVPKSNTGLGNWVHHQRVGYRKLKQGKKSIITTAKALKLAEIGFPFVARRKERNVDINNRHQSLSDDE